MSGSGYELARRQADDLPALMSLADAFGRSGMFKVDNAEQAFVKLMTGAELGLTPAQAMREIHVVEGAPMVGATIYATKLRQHPRYDYRLLEHTDKACAVAFYGGDLAKHGPYVHERDPELPAWKGLRPGVECLGVHRRTIKEAQDLGWTKTRGGKVLTTYAQHADAMLFARVISQGGRFFAPDAVQGFYTHGEIEAPAKPETPETLEATFQALAGHCKGGLAHLWEDGDESGTQVCGRCGGAQQLDDEPATEELEAHEEATRDDLPPDVQEAINGGGTEPPAIDDEDLPF